MSFLDLGYRTVLYCTVSNMQVSLLVVYIRTRNTFTLQRGVRHDQHVLVIWAFVTTWRAPPKIVGVDRGGGGTKSSYTHRLSFSLSQLLLFEKHLCYNIVIFHIYEGMKPARTFVTVLYNSTLRMLGSSIQV